jgi:hypothetical protein
VSQDSSEQQESPDQGGAVSVPDEQLPEDLRPTEDNPLAEPVDDDVEDDVIVEGFGAPGSSGGSGDASQSGNGDASDTSPSEASSETPDETSKE